MQCLAHSNEYLSRINVYKHIHVGMLIYAFTRLDSKTSFHRSNLPVCNDSSLVLSHINLYKHIHVGMLMYFFTCLASKTSFH